LAEGAFVVMNMQSNLSTISVSGSGRIMAEPDFLKITVSISCVSKNMKIAQQSVNEDIHKLMDILNKYKVDKDSIHNVDLTFTPKYEWENNSHVFKGQEIKQIISIQFNIGNNTDELAGKILDEITTLQYVSDCDVNYGLVNDTALYEKARELSFKNAKMKAEHYAKLGGLKIVKTQSISDEATVQITVRDYEPDTKCCEAMDTGSTYLPSGRQLEVENTIFVVFLVE
jgi:uncharacterized protein YggE